jgi:MFS family permease
MVLKMPSGAGMRSFTAIWVGQFFSFLGTGMTNFALTLWAWKMTGSATALALVGLFFTAPTILASPLAGALVDRWNRKLVMMLTDAAAGVSTLTILILFSLGRLEVWHIYVTTAFAGFFNAFQFPAYSATISLMVSKDQYQRASGMLTLAQNASGILAPIAAGVLVNFIDYNGIFTLDLVTLTLALTILLLLKIPQPPATEAATAKKRSLLEDSLFGFNYIRQRPGLLGLQLVFFTLNFTTALCFPLLAPMILSRTGNDTIILGTVQSAFGVGGVLGGVIVSVWGGPKNKIRGVLFGMIAGSLLGLTVIGLGSSVYVWAMGALLMLIFFPITNSSSQAIWMSKVPPELQGRVFSTRLLIAQISTPIAMLVTGPLADGLLLPGMMEGGSLAPIFGWLVGVGPGTGISLLMFLMGLTGVLVGLAAFAFKPVRDVEKMIPDHDTPATNKM